MIVGIFLFVLRLAVSNRVSIDNSRSAILSSKGSAGLSLLLGGPVGLGGGLLGLIGGLVGLPLSSSS